MRGRVSSVVSRRGARPRLAHEELLVLVVVVLVPLRALAAWSERAGWGGEGALRTARRAERRMAPEAEDAARTAGTAPPQDAGEEPVSPSPRARIAALPESVVHRIAAGEVVQRPASALKELLDNSVDAGARSVRVVTKGGGLSLLQVSDDGCGVAEGDMELLCVRHATSKMRREEDLQDMATLGFRGEALASMSYVAHLSCVTRRRPDAGGGEGGEGGAGHATHAKYRDGRMIESTAAAGTYGTSITIEDLFYATPLRKKALRSASEEYRRIVDTVSRYAVHHRGVAFSCRRLEDGMKPPDVHVGAADSVRTRIDLVYGKAVGGELIEVALDSRVEEPVAGPTPSPSPTPSPGPAPPPPPLSGDEFTLTGYITSANYHASRTTMVLFINDRLVEMTPLRRAVESVYASLLPKSSKPFLYFAIETHRGNVDVNMHPTKHEVGLLNAEKIIQEVQARVERVLLESNDGRTYVFSQTQSVRPRPGPSQQREQANKLIPREESERLRQKAAGRDPGARPGPAYAPNRLVRTDASMVPLEAFALGSQQIRPSQQPRRPGAGQQEDAAPAAAARGAAGAGGAAAGAGGAASGLLDALEATASADLQLFFKNHVYVGMMTPSQALVQFRTGLYAIDMAALSRELGYQLMLRMCAARERGGGARPAGDGDGGAPAAIRLGGKLPVGETLRRALRALREDGEYEGDDEGIELLVRGLRGVLGRHRDWLERTLGLAFEAGGDGETEAYLLSLPACFGPQYLPDHGRLPDFLLAVARDVDWDGEEGGRVDAVCRAVADLFTFTVDEEALNAKDGDRGQPARPGGGDWQMQHILSPLLKSSHFSAPEELNGDGSVLLVTKLETLYRVFERC